MDEFRESFYPEDGFRKARQDLERVRPRLEDGDTADAAFHLHQALEKALKGFLLRNGCPLRRIHDLRALLAEAERFAPVLKQYRTLCREVSAYYVLERYPFFVAEPAAEEIGAQWEAAVTLFRFLAGESVGPAPSTLPEEA